MKKPIATKDLPPDGPPGDEYDSQLTEWVAKDLYEKGEARTAWEDEALPLLAGIRSQNATEARYATAALGVRLTLVLERAVDRLVASSNGNTETMGRLTERYVALTDSNVRLQRWVVALTFVVAASALLQVGVQAWSAFRPTPPPQVLVQPVPLQVTIAPSPTPATPPPSTR